MIYFSIATMLSIAIVGLISINLKKEEEEYYYLKIILLTVFSSIGLFLNEKIPIPLGFLGSLYLIMRTHENKKVKIFVSIVGVVLFFIGYIPSLISIISYIIK